MFDIKYDTKTQTISMSGQFEASKANECKEVFEKINNSVTVDMKNLDFICSAGIGILVMTYNRFKDTDNSIYLTNLNVHITKVFKACLLDTVFEIK